MTKTAHATFTLREVLRYPDGSRKKFRLLAIIARQLKEIPPRSLGCADLVARYYGGLA